MKPYKISVPVMCANISEDNRPKTLDELKRCGARRVFVAISAYHTNKETRSLVLSDLKDKIDLFKSHGYEVGVWLWSSLVQDENSFQRKVNSKGEEHSTWVCHADEGLLTLAADLARDIARLGPDLIMYDDDFKYSRDTTGLHGCFCKWHRKLLRDMYGDSRTLDEVAKGACADAYSEDRKIWYSVMGKGLENYAAAMRRAVDEIDPKIRMGFCANLSGYGIEGTDVKRLSRIFAGDTEPYVRTIGAPYWDWYSEYPRKLAEVFEVERHQAKILEGSGIEMMCEGDVYPRPRSASSAAYLELFDTVMMANGGHDGILKYVLDYYSPADYETGYVDAHVKNTPVYEKIREHFSEKKAVGVRVFSSDRIFAETNEKFAFGTDKYEYTHGLVSTQAGRILSQLSIPTTYEDKGVATAAFGEYARFLDEKDKVDGILTDLAGALALKERGIDVGLCEVGEKLRIAGEDFGDGYYHPILDKDGYYRVSVDSRAKILSYYTTRFSRFCGDLENMGENEKVPAAYLYENADGQRFCVLTFVAVAVSAGFRSYLKSEQLANALEWLSGKRLPAKCMKNPDLYMLCKQDGDELCIGLWNLSPDAITAPVVKLAEKYSVAECISCTGDLVGNTLTLSPLAAFSFCGVVLKK